MATPREMVSAISIAMCIPVETVAVHDRLLAEAGLRTRAKRGRGKTSMTPQDAANLVVSVAASATPKDGVSAVIANKPLAALVAREIESAIDDQNNIEWVRAKYTATVRDEGDLRVEATFGAATIMAIANLIHIERYGPELAKEMMAAEAAKEE